jgi:hypothetical protein
LFQQRKNKRFTYKSRLQDSANRKSKDDLETKWNELKEGGKRKGSMLTSLAVLISLLVFIFVLIYVLDGYIK